MFDRITFDPALMGGRACIRGMRMTVALVVNLVANGMSREEIIGEHPELEREPARCLGRAAVEGKKVGDFAPYASAEEELRRLEARAFGPAVHSLGRIAAGWGRIAARGL